MQQRVGSGKASVVLLDYLIFLNCSQEVLSIFIDADAVISMEHNVLFCFLIRLINYVESP